MRVSSWNVNGIRSIARKGFLPWLESCGADVVALQETRVRPDQLPPELSELPGWHAHYVAADKPGYSGVAVVSRRAPDEVTAGLGIKTFDIEGRVAIARFGALRVVSGYFPNGSGQARDNSRVPYKLRFYKRLHKVLEPLKKQGAPILVLGDFNTAPDEIDLARPKDNQKTSGFLPDERKELARWVKTGWVDTYRAFETRGDRYTWWSQRFGVRERNVGWRIDLAMASPGAMKYVRGAGIEHDVMGSDHCPIYVDLDPAVISHDL